MTCSKNTPATKRQVAISRTWGVIPLGKGGSAQRRWNFGGLKKGERSHPWRKEPDSKVPMKKSFTTSAAM